MIFFEIFPIFKRERKTTIVNALKVLLSVVSLLFVILVTLLLTFLSLCQVLLSIWIVTAKCSMKRHKGRMRRVVILCHNSQLRAGIG